MAHDIIKQEARTFRTKLTCSVPQCTGESIFDGKTMSDSNGNWFFEHKCNKCSNVTWEDASYPIISYEVI